MIASSYCEESRAKRSMSRRASANQVQGMECEDELPADLSTREPGSTFIQRRMLRPCCDGGRAMGSGQARAKGGLTMFAVDIRVPASKLAS